jgi:flagellum-specific ATP synthase
MDKVFRVYGKVVKVSGVYLEATVPVGAVGNQCIIKTEAGDVEGEVIGFMRADALLCPLVVYWELNGRQGLDKDGTRIHRRG